MPQNSLLPAALVPCQLEVAGVFRVNPLALALILVNDGALMATLAGASGVSCYSESESHRDVSTLMICIFVNDNLVT